MVQLDPEGAGSFADRIEQTAEQIQELGVDLADYADALELDEEAFLAMEDRIELIQRLKHKHGRSVEQILAKAEELRERLEAFDNRQDVVEKLENAVAAAERDLGTRCAALHAERAKAAAALAAAIETKLRRLGFQQAAFQVDVTETEPGPTGSDRVEFCIAPNIGEPLLPLRQIASSGEMARIMLAIKTVLTQADSVPVLIFDEVDANIGGRVAVIVAEELAAIAGSHQVMSITHLPQIAAAGDCHFLVTKSVADGRTVTSMTLLNAQSREREIARMMGAPDHSEAAAVHARELLEKAAPKTGAE
jgi:DNA repair protein RecN (Recombination protein N)